MEIAFWLNNVSHVHIMLTAYYTWFKEEFTPINSPLSQLLLSTYLFEYPAWCIIDAMTPAAMIRSTISSPFDPS